MLALIAGQGALPGQLIKALKTPALIAALDGFPPEGLTPDITFRLETLGSFLAEMSARGVTEVCFAGSIRRSPLDASKVDTATAPLLPAIVEALQSGDDAALRTVLGIFEAAGLKITAAQEIDPALLPEPGVVTGKRPTDADERNAIRAAEIMKALGPADVGQACVVHDGQALAIEAHFGTDWMLDSLLRRPDGRGGLLFKAPKPGQDRRIDLPAIGPDTIARAAKAGLSGVVIEAGGVMVVDRDAAIVAADHAGLFLWVRDA